MLDITYHWGNAHPNHSNMLPHTCEQLKPTTQGASLGEDTEEKGAPCTAGGNANWRSHSGKQHGGSSKNKNRTTLPHDPVSPLLGIYPKNTETLIQKNTGTPMFTAALFIIAKFWKQPKCPSIDEWIKKR